MAVTHDDVQRWLNSYIAAWRTYDSGAVGDLFTDDAEYRYHPWDEPIRGRREIVRAWVAPEGNESRRDEPETWDAHYEPYVVEGDRAVAVGWSRYLGQDGAPDKHYHNCYLLGFGDDGRCRTFTEYYVEQT
jgi:ketosteroid isomerase-like protein